MSWKNVLLFLWVYFNVVKAVPSNLTECRENSWPYDLITPFPYRTLEPMEIDTSAARVLNISDPIKFVTGIFERYTVRNTGFNVQIIPNHPSITSLTGGPLGKDVYTFYRGGFFWSGSYTGTASGKFDQLGAPVQGRAIFRNTKYGTFENAINHRDGLATIVTNVQVEGYVPNPTFDVFAGLLKNIQKAGTSVQVNSPIPLFSWYNNVPTLVKYYYAYPGAYIDFENGNTQYDCATMIVYPKAYQSAISIPQYQYFQKVLNCGGTPISNALSARPSNGRPLVQIYGFEEIAVPTSL